MHRPGRSVGAAALVLDEDGRVLLVRHTYGRFNWELPGGGSEPNESFAQTALRELREETGLDARIDRLTGIYYKQDRDSHHLVFRCTVGNQTPAPSSAEISACGFWPVTDLPRPISDFTVRRVHDGITATVPQVVEVPTLTWIE